MTFCDFPCFDSVSHCHTACAFRWCATQFGCMAALLCMLHIHVKMRFSESLCNENKIKKNAVNAVERDVLHELARWETCFLLLCAYVFIWNEFYEIWFDDVYDSCWRRVVWRLTTPHADAFLRGTMQCNSAQPIISTALTTGLNGNDGSVASLVAHTASQRQCKVFGWVCGLMDADKVAYTPLCFAPATNKSEWVQRSKSVNFTTWFFLASVYCTSNKTVFIY